jgi:hypothetical protein
MLCEEYIEALSDLLYEGEKGYKILVYVKLGLSY